MVHCPVHTTMMCFVMVYFGKSSTANVYLNSLHSEWRHSGLVEREGSEKKIKAVRESITQTNKPV